MSECAKPVEVGSGPCLSALKPSREGGWTFRIAAVYDRCWKPMKQQGKVGHRAVPLSKPHLRGEQQQPGRVQLSIDALHAFYCYDGVWQESV
jgi:hypothetical protein